MPDQEIARVSLMCGLLLLAASPPETWHGDSWRSGSDIRQQWHDDKGNQVYCTTYRAGNDIRTDCHSWR